MDKVSSFRPHARVVFDTDGPSLTRQEFAAECDINTIMARYQKMGTVSHMNLAQPKYLDVADVPDLQTAMSVLHAADDAFMRLPAKVRKEFDNNPLRFVEYAQDPANLDQMRAWDLAPPVPPKQPTLAEEVATALQAVSEAAPPAK